MPIIKLNAIDSTNSYLKKLCTNKEVENNTVVVAKSQTQGRGQMGTNWQVEVGKNLTFSTFKQLQKFNVDHQFFISIAVSLGIIKTLEQFGLPKLHVKWPNDILSEEKKICGILIENVIKNQELVATIIGVGLNVNQTQFKNLPRASSLKIITGTLFDLDELLHHILKNIDYYFEDILNKSHESLLQSYEKLLFRKDKPSTFKSVEGEMFSGYIKGVEDSGKLKVLLEDEVIKSFSMKQIELLY
jgi:BirA family biotin operon repressor/biotin-[acetyl-CoA-carboxylase] ligase